MQKRILWINPGGTDVFNRLIEDYLARYKETDTEVSVVSMPRGPHHLEYQYYCTLALPDILHKIKESERAGFDGAIIGGFYDLGLQEAREITEDFVVTAPAEACLHIATTLGDSFSILVGHERWVPVMRDNVVKYGFKDNLASFKAINMGVLDFHVDEAETLSRLLIAGREAIEKDRANVLILGCTIEFGFFLELQEKLKVPVLDPVLTPFKYAEFLIALKKLFNWTHSKYLRYETPPSREILEWDLPHQYSFEKELWE